MATPGPPTLTLVVCPVCLRDDRLTALREKLPHNRPQGGKCPGRPVRVVYARMHVEEERR